MSLSKAQEPSRDEQSDYRGRSRDRRSACAVAGSNPHGKLAQGNAHQALRGPERRMPPNRSGDHERALVAGVRDFTGEILEQVSRRATTATRQPSAAMTLAVPRPMPWVAPTRGVPDRPPACIGRRRVAR